MNSLFFLPRAFRYRLAFTVLALAFLTTSETFNAQKSDARRDRVEGEVITILPTGFEPSRITRPPGLFLILVDNRSELDDLILQLNSVSGQRLREVEQRGANKILKQLEDLPPGEYLLTEAGHADWVCRITITPH